VPRKLKVFRAHFGFYDEIVAAPSQKAALEAWGAKPHEFSQGFAKVTEESALVAAALAQPGIVLKRQFGSKGAFKADAKLARVPATSTKKQEALARAKRKREEDAARQAEREAAAAAARERKEKLRDIERREAALAEEKRAIRKEFAKKESTKKRK
jgi:colicin import membrane protein